MLMEYYKSCKCDNDDGGVSQERDLIAVVISCFFACAPFPKDFHIILLGLRRIYVFHFLYQIKLYQCWLKSEFSVILFKNGFFSMSRFSVI
jgi:hypothetical protein